MAQFDVSVHAVIFDDQNRILLGHRCDMDLWDLPGGSLEPGELPTDGAIRETREETGLHVILEPGSAFAWETGELVSTVEDIVGNQGIRTAITDVSFTAHMPDCLEMPYKPVILGATDEIKGSLKKLQKAIKEQ